MDGTAAAASVTTGIHPNNDRASSLNTLARSRVHAYKIQAVTHRVSASAIPQISCSSVVGNNPRICGSMLAYRSSNGGSGSVDLTTKIVNSSGLSLVEYSPAWSANHSLNATRLLIMLFSRVIVIQSSVIRSLSMTLCNHHSVDLTTKVGNPPDYRR